MGLLLAAAAAQAAAQAGPQITPRAPSDKDKQEVYSLLDDIRAAVRNDDWSEAWRLANRMNNTLFSRRIQSGQVSPGLELAHVEMMASKDATTRTPLLPRLAKAAYAAGQYKKAEGYAKEALDAAAQGSFWWTGDAVHQGNIVLGRLALDRGDNDAAAKYLIAAGKTPGSTALGVFGPNMGLARDLLLLGKPEPVIRYLEECREFWKTDRGKLAEWLALVRAGLVPDFGRNVDY